MTVLCEPVVGARPTTTPGTPALSRGTAREARSSKTQRVDHLGRPQSDDHVRLAAPAENADSVAKRAGQVRALRVERAGHLLEVGEARPVLDVQQGPRVNVPRDEIRAAGELVMLIRLVDADLIAQRSQMRSLELTHRRVHRIRAQTRPRVALPRVREHYVETQAEGGRQTNDRFH